jgi:hypothetical protein
MHVFPTRDIHLLTAYPDAHIDLTWCMDWPPNQANQTWTDLVTVANDPPGLHGGRVSGQADNPASVRTVHSAVPSPTGISLATRDVGTAFYFLRAFFPGTSIRTVVRVRTHEDLRALFFPTARIRMFPGRSDHVLTVFAQFTDDTFADVTEHPYLRFTSSNHAVATVEATTGRVTAVAPGRATITVQTTTGLLPQTCEVVVEDALSRAWRGDLLVRRIHAPVGARRTLYLVAEGYADMRRAERHAYNLHEQIFTDEANAPFRWLKDQFRVVFISILGDRRGISIGPTLKPDDATGFSIPRDNAALDPDARDWLDPARDSPFGLMYGERMGGPRAYTAVPEQIANVDGAREVWLGKAAGRSVSVDHRRIGPYREIGAGGVRVFDPRTRFLESFEALLRDLGPPFRFGPDDRVAFYVDDQFRGGARLSVAGLEPPENRFVALTIGDLRGFDTGPAALVRPPDSPFMIRTPIRETFHARAVASSIVHELGHSYGLGDEYEDHPGAPSADDVRRHDIERYDNLQLLPDVLVGGTVALERVKWRVHQVVKSSEVVARQRGSGNLTVTLAEDARKWKPGEIVFLRTSFATPRERDAAGNVDPAIPRIRAFRFQVTDTDGRDVLMVSHDAGPTDEQLARCRVLYLPRRDGDGHPMHLIDPVVEKYLDPRAEVFPRPTTCAVPGQTLPVAPPDIPGLKKPTYREDLIGLYEGGHEYACGVVRPAGRCKMRAGANYVGEAFDGVWEFCFVCKFILVDRLDPSQLARVQVHYPKDC